MILALKFVQSIYKTLVGGSMHTCGAHIHIFQPQEKILYETLIISHFTGLL